MKSLHMLPLCSVLAIAHTHGQREPHVGVCGSRVLTSLFTNLDPICRPNVSRTGYLAPEGRSHISYNMDGCSQANCTAHEDHPQQHPWTHSSPCFRSKENQQQYCVFSDSAFAENRGTTLVTSAKRAARLSNNPAFTDPSVTRGINQDIVRTTPAKYKVEKIEGKGMGVVATGFIGRGELIMANTVSLMFDYNAYENLERANYLELQAKAIDALPETHRQRFLDLSTHDEANFTYLEFVEKIASTNAFDIDIDPDEEDEDEENGFYVVFPEIARMNHDCRPNADYYFNLETMTQYIHAIRPIFPGEEITITYINPVMTQARRERKLQSTWGFKCSCPSCTSSKFVIASSDDRLRQIEELSPELANHRADSRATPQMAELLISLYEQEKLWGMMYQAYKYAAIEWNGVGEPWTATKYARLAVEYGIYSSGEKDGDVADMDSLATDPWSHWSWMLRTRMRMGWNARKNVVEQDEEDEE